MAYLSTVNKWGLSLGVLVSVASEEGAKNLSMENDGITCILGKFRPYPSQIVVSLSPEA